jgi:hypothetical protein
MNNIDDQSTELTNPQTKILTHWQTGEMDKSTFNKSIKRLIGNVMK